MTAKEYLSQIQRLEYKISRMKLRAEEYQRLSESIPGQSYDGIRVDGTRNLDAPFVKWLMKKADLEQEIKVLEEKLANLKAEIVTCIESLDNEDYKNLLVMHYIKGMSWQEISDKMYVSQSTIFRWHRESLDLIKVPLKMTVDDSK